MMELWLVRDVGGRDPLRPEIDGLYDASAQLGPARVSFRCSCRPRHGVRDRGPDKALETLERVPLAGRRLVEPASPSA